MNTTKRLGEQQAGLWLVCEWGSHPNEGNDDCHTGEEFDTEAKARAAFNTGKFDKDTAYVTIHGPDGLDPDDTRAVKKNPRHKPRNRGAMDLEMRRELAIEEGTLHGIDAYNDAMGY